MNWSMDTNIIKKKKVDEEKLSKHSTYFFINKK